MKWLHTLHCGDSGIECSVVYCVFNKSTKWAGFCMQTEYLHTLHSIPLLKNEQSMLVLYSEHSQQLSLQYFLLHS